MRKIITTCLLSIWLFLQETLNICSDGCLMCDGKDTCKLCDASSLYVLVKDTCLKQNLEFCMLAFNIDACSVCFAGYYLETNKKCVTNPSGANEIKNCERYSSYTRCAQCAKNFFLANNNRKCERVAEKIQNCKVYSGNNTCAVCSDSIRSFDGRNCQIVDRVEDSCLFYSNSTICKSCREGFYLDHNYYSNNIVDVYSQLISAVLDYDFTFNQVVNLPQCAKITDIPHCLALDFNLNCLRCENGYYVNTTTSRECLKNPDLKISVFSDDIPFCYIHNRTPVTVSGITKIEVTCQFCYEGYYITINGKKCSAHESTVKNCAVYSQTKNSECILCLDGYFRANIGTEKCILRGTNTGCKVVHPMAQSCNQCVQSNYVKHLNETFCSAPISNCKIYNLDSEILTCKVCEANYYFNINSKTCELNSNFDPYCSFYKQDQTCEKCYLGFFFNKISGKCEPSDAEYVSIANCLDYDLNQKNTCVDCDNFNTLIQLANTCKLIPFDTATYDFNQIKYCDTFEVDTLTGYKCTKPLYRDLVAQPYCLPDLSNCTIRVLNVTDGLVYENPKTLSNCRAYSETVTSKNSVSCLQCIKEITMADYFYTTDVCATSEKIPWCLDGTDYRGANNFCFKALDSGGRVFMGQNVNSPSTTYVTTSSPYVFGSNTYYFCFTTGSGTPCYYQGTTSYNTGFPCSLNSVVPINGVSYCKNFDNFNCNTEGTYERTVKYFVTLTEDSSECIIERIYHTVNNCFKIKDEICVLCAREFFPDRFKQVLYPFDYVETYLSHANEHFNMENCINYNSILNECLQCDPTTGTKINFAGRCIECTSGDKVTDKTGLKCISFYSETFTQGTCMKADDVYSPFICIQCSELYVGIYSLDLTNTPLLTSGEYLYVKNVRTYVYKIVKTFGISNCIKKTDLFISNILYREKSAYCDWARLTLGTAYCLKCIFGYSGTLGMTSSSINFLENCNIDPICDINTRYIFDQPHVRQLLSCNKCVAETKIVTLYMYYEKSATASNAIFKFSNSARTWDCEPVDSTLDRNCLVQLFINDPIFKSKIGNKSYLCLSCPPKYFPTTQPVIDDLFPFNYVTACTLIQNCKESNITNVCEQCNPNFVLSASKTACEPIPPSNPSLEFCNEIAYSAGVPYCTKCKNGYIFLEASPVSKCLPYNATNCLYFDESRCLQSTKKMGTLYNIIYRKYFTSYFINQPNCKTANNLIINCDFYKTNTTCFICKDGFTLGNSAQNCYVQDVENCVAYEDSIMKCSACKPGYLLDFNRNCVVSPVGSIPKCVKYSGVYCTECEPGFYPIKINSGQGSLCLNTTISNLCEEVDYSQLDNNLILECKTCMKISTVISKLSLNELSLNVFSFLLESTYEKFKSNNNVLLYPSNVTAQVYLRAAKYNYKNTFICKGYGGVTDCLTHDDTAISKTFKCTQCKVTHYLQNNYCLLRTPKENCIVYNPVINDCQTYLDDSSYAFTYSTFDYMIMNRTIPKPPTESLGVISIEGCVSYVNSQTCKFCNSTMYLYDNLCLSVTTLNPNCQMYSANMVCSKCQEGYLLMQNKCLPVYAKNCDGYLTNTKCLRCKPEYPVLLMDGNCYKNPEVANCDLFANPNSCSFCASDFTNIKGQCKLPKKYVTNCERHIGTSLCMKCRPNWVLSVNQRECLLNPTYDRNCEEFETKSYCIVCQPGHFFRGNTCFKCLTDISKCLFCNAKNPAVCKVCRPGFFMDNYGLCLQSVGYQSQIILNQNEDTKNKETLKAIGIFRSMVLWMLAFLIGWI